MNNFYFCKNYCNIFSGFYWKNDGNSGKACDGESPDIRHNGYGEWAAEFFDNLNIETAYIAEASFEGLGDVKSINILFSLKQKYFRR